MKGLLGDLPYEFFINYPVFGSTRAGELRNVFNGNGNIYEVRIDDAIDHH